MYYVYYITHMHIKMHMFNDTNIFVLCWIYFFCPSKSIRYSFNLLFAPGYPAVFTASMGSFALYLLNGFNRGCHWQWREWSQSGFLQAPYLQKCHSWLHPWTKTIDSGRWLSFKALPPRLITSLSSCTFRGKARNRSQKLLVLEFLHYSLGIPYTTHNCFVIITLLNLPQINQFK